MYSILLYIDTLRTYTLTVNATSVLWCVYHNPVSLLPRFPFNYTYTWMGALTDSTYIHTGTAIHTYIEWHAIASIDLSTDSINTQCHFVLCIVWTSTSVSLLCYSTFLLNNTVLLLSTSPSATIVYHLAHKSTTAIVHLNVNKTVIQHLRWFYRSIVFIIPSYTDTPQCCTWFPLHFRDKLTLNNAWVNPL